MYDLEYWHLIMVCSHTYERETARFRQLIHPYVEVKEAQFKDHIFARHTHENYSVSLYQHDAHKFYYQGETHVAIAGDIVLVNADGIHDGQSANGDFYHLLSLSPSEHDFLALQEDPQNTKAVAPLFCETIVRNAALYRQLREFFQLSYTDDCRLELESRYLGILSTINEHYCRSTKPEEQLKTKPVAVTRVREYIDAHYSENISLQTLANLVNLNPYYLIRLFKKSVGIPPHTYQVQRRVTEAKRMIQQGMSLALTAHTAGFTDQSHLNRHFRKRYGISPGHFIT